MNFIITSNNKKNILNNLGHELFFTRKIVLALLEQKYIDTNYIIVTKNEDRKFLYSKIFPSVYTYKEYTEGNIFSYKQIKIIINLEDYLCTRYTQINNSLNQLNINGNTLNEAFTSNYMTNEHIKLSKTFDLSNININNKFIIIHIKSYNAKTNKEIYKLINSSFKINYIIYCYEYNKLEFYNKTSNNVLYINNLKLYASYLNHSNCVCLISEWSGGGQLSQFILNTQVIYYYEKYPDTYTDNNYITYQNISSTSFTSAWDHVTYTKLNKKFIKTKDNINLCNIIYEIITKL